MSVDLEGIWDQGPRAAGSRRRECVHGDRPLPDRPAPGFRGMGVVYEAYDREREQRVALKTLFFDDPSAIYRLKHEFRALADVAHPNLITFYELIREGDVWFITMELVEGETFLDYVRPWNPKDSAAKLDLTRLRAALPQLVEGVYHLHAHGKWHRDLKPGNVLVTKDGRVVLLDFGISAQIQSEGPATVATGAVGTVAYMAPEQVDGGSSTPTSDWYAVGVMLYEALTGHLPFSGPLLLVLEAKLKETPPHPSDHAADLPEDLVRLCLDLISRDATDRPSGEDILTRLGRSGPVRAMRAAMAEAGTTIMGREPHLEILKGSFERSRSGRAVSVHVHGVSGIGKTYLVEHFLNRLDPALGTVVLTGRCYPRESMPYKAVDGVIDSLTRYLRSLEEQDVLDLLPREILYLARIFPVLMQVGRDMDLPVSPSRRARDAQELRKRAFSALRRLLGSIAARHPLVLIIDDLQWADVDSVALLDDLTRPDRAPPLLLVCCFRSIGGEAPAFLTTLRNRPGDENTVDLPVGPLTDPEAEHLVRLRIRSEEVEPVVRSIVREAAGSPFVLEQLIRHVLECEKSEMTNATLAVMLDARIDRLPPGSRELLDTLSVAERPVDFEVVHEAAGIEGDARALVGTLEVAHLVRTSAEADEIETYHDRIRECLAEQLSPEKTVQIHLRLAHAIRRRGTEDPEALFEHYLKAGRPTQAAEQAVKAGHISMKALAFDRAARFFRHALELAPLDAEEEQELKIQLAEALANAGRPAEAADAFLEASEGQGPATALTCKVRAAGQLLFGGHSDRGLEVTRDILRSVGLKMASSRKVGGAGHPRPHGLAAPARSRGSNPGRRRRCRPPSCSGSTSPGACRSGCCWWTPSSPSSSPRGTC